MTKEQAIGYVLLSLQDIRVKGIKLNDVASDSKQEKVLINHMSDMMDDFSEEYAEQFLESFLSKF